ncbi:MAG: CPBP family intramembrane metalloprotease [Paracoccus sp. (in: a-proteobacteria)]|nr:CPBP family intramembrane metalloprotease [Paracoccus sp. (in: a-proteobacteria)]
MAESSPHPLSAPAEPGGRDRARRLAEFAALFVAAPVLIALILPPQMMFRALFALSLVGLGLLWLTGGFAWRDMLRGRFSLTGFLAFAAVTTAASAGVLYLTRPEALFGLLRAQPLMLLLIWMLYPLLSALPQELIFRVLFFHRYGRLFASRRQAVVVNAAIFSLAHLMYWNWIVLVFTFFGGIVFATGYLKRGFLWAWALHAIAGNILFAVGMGIYFYSGAVVRPF